MVAFWAKKQSRIAQENLDICSYADGKLHIFLSQKALLRGDDNTEDALIFYMTELGPAVLNKVYRLLSDTYSIKSQKAANLNGSYQINKATQNYQLTSREQEVLFFLLRGHTCKEIAFRLKISPKTVETYVASSKLKMNCHNRGQLIEKAMGAGFLFNIPKSLIVED